MASTSYLPEPSNPRPFVARFTLICVLLFLALQLNAHFPVIRFSSGIANQIVFLLSCGLPWIAFVLGFSVQRAWAKWVLCIALVPVLLWSMVAAGSTLIVAGTEFQPVNRV